MILFSFSSCFFQIPILQQHAMKHGYSVLGSVPVPGTYWVPMFSQQSSNSNSNGSSSQIGSSRNNTSIPVTEKCTSGSGSVDNNNPLWAYVTVLQNRTATKANARWKCNFCKDEFNGSYYRVKSHLLRQKNKGIAICAQVTSEYLVEMTDLELNASKKVESVQVPFPTGTTNLNPPVDKNKRRRGDDGPLSKAYNNEAREHLSAQIARLFYAAGLPFNVARNPYFISAFSYAANTNISGYIPPSYDAIRTTMLQREKSNIMKLLQPIKDTWVEKGVSIVTDGWTDSQKRPLINFMATSTAGPIFLKAIDCTGEVKDRNYIANLILSAIDEVGAQNVVQVITDNAPVCKAAGSIVENMHPHIFWTPCVVHTLNLALKNICSPSPNNEVAYDPIYDMLRSCDTDEPNLHLVYDKWDSMIDRVKSAIYQHEGKELTQYSSFYDVVYNILTDRWSKSNIPLHCLAHSLNPKHYCKEWLDQYPTRVAPHRDNEICQERNKCLKSYFQDVSERREALAEFVKFSSAEGELGQFDSLLDRWNLTPKEWWVTYGSSIPKLQSIALKLFSQPTSSSSAERNWSTYGFIQSTKRNKINPKKAEDLVFIHTNLRLLSRNNKTYKEGPTKMWDIGGDEFDLVDGAGILEVASLSLDEPELEAALFNDDGDGNIFTQ
ncbi:hypothetical protein TSUD_191890 [Trifolium subterraneum]|uniref:BED-type domain-containing protein n=1 Tax=Trifolium subterraneum TaxID=3900 RepID=A0A2Z6P4Q2_TRISU|nr:hypothetical protein TSUD_191890 [Trifolium subterraneum]